MILCLFIWCLSVLLNHVPTLLVTIFCTAHNNFYSRVYNDHERICSQVVREICSTHIYGFEQSELDVIIDSSYLILYVYFSHASVFHDIIYNFSSSFLFNVVVIRHFNMVNLPWIW